MVENISNNAEQYAAFKEITELILNNDQKFVKCFFLDGPAGSGKTYLYNTIIRYLTSHGKKVLAHATTGIASDLLIGGATMHSRFKLPLKLDNLSKIKMDINSKLAQ